MFETDALVKTRAGLLREMRSSVGVKLVMRGGLLKMIRNYGGVQLNDWHSREAEITRVAHFPKRLHDTLEDCSMSMERMWGRDWDRFGVVMNLQLVKFARERRAFLGI